MKKRGIQGTCVGFLAMLFINSKGCLSSVTLGRDNEDGKTEGGKPIRTMIDMVKRFFRKSARNEVAEHLDKRCKDTQVATCAILLEMARIDSEFSKDEQESLISILKKRYGLSNEDAEGLIQVSNEELEGSIDLWRFTNLINRRYAIEDKLEIIRTVWEIAYADGKLEKHEDYLVHKLAKLLHLTHKQLIDAKLSVLEDRKN